MYQIVRDRSARPPAPAIEEKASGTGTVNEQGDRIEWAFDSGDTSTVSSSTNAGGSTVVIDTYNQLVGRDERAALDDAFASGVCER